MTLLLQLETKFPQGLFDIIEKIFPQGPFDIIEKDLNKGLLLFLKTVKKFTIYWASHFFFNKQRVLIKPKQNSDQIV